MRKTVTTSRNPKRPSKPVRKFGTLKGKVKIVDPRWAAPMTARELDAFLEGR